MPLRKGRSINQEDIWLREDASETKMGVKTTLQPSAPSVNARYPRTFSRNLKNQVMMLAPSLIY